MKKYKSHKIVEAAKIVEIVSNVDPEQSGVLLEFDDGKAVAINRAWVERFQPRLGGYYVKYPDGYESYSPAEAFESGYTELGKEPKAFETIGDGFELSQFYSSDLATRIWNDFKYHEPVDDSQKANFDLIRSQTAKLAFLINGSVPNGREKSTALTKLEEVMFWSNAAIARHWPKEGEYKG